MTRLADKDLWIEQQNGWSNEYTNMSDSSDQMHGYSEIFPVAFS